ncbi:DUF5131 family protein [Streptomyces mirabilis]|uniref:DUF5131 family protein n=1 Tax=Streptomyces mirabilis TaxID=68239 RepID=UPI00331FE8A4
MADNTSIEWTDSTWNPVTGCTKISPGCDVVQWLQASVSVSTVRCPRWHKWWSAVDLPVPDRCPRWLVSGGAETAAVADG